MFEDTTEERPRPRRQLVPKAVAEQNEGGLLVDTSLDILPLRLAEKGLKPHILGCNIRWFQKQTFDFLSGS